MENTMDFTKHKYEAILIREPECEKSDDWQKTAFKWIIKINDVEFDYYTGHGNVTPKKLLWHDKNHLKQLQATQNAFNERLTNEGFKQLLSYVEPIKPKIEDVLYSLVLDSEACEMSFEDWCCNFGCDTDSIEALETYRACQKNTDKLRKAGIYINDELREFFQDY